MDIPFYSTGSATAGVVRLQKARYGSRHRESFGFRNILHSVKGNKMVHFRTFRKDKMAINIDDGGYHDGRVVGG